MISMIKMYTNAVCPYCHAAKRLLTERGFEFEEVSIEREGLNREKLFEMTGGRTVPQIIINDKPIGGYDNLLVLDQNGDLSKITA